MAARERFNDSAALVLRAVLKSTEAKQTSVTEVRSGKVPFKSLDLFLRSL